MVILNRVSFLQAYILRLDRISVRSTWENIQLFSLTSKFVYLPSKRFRRLVDAQQDLNGDSWEEMLWDFKDLVSDLYAKWQGCLMQSLELPERIYFESIRNMTATKRGLAKSLFKLSRFIAQKFGQKVIVLIDEYEAPNNRAYDRGYFDEVGLLYTSL